MTTDSTLTPKTLARALHEAFDGAAGVGHELNCYACAQWPDENTPDYSPEPGNACWELAVAILSALHIEVND